MLREIGVTAAKPPEPRNCQQRFIDEYRRYLLQERGLAETSLLNYVPFAEQFLSDRFGQSDMNLSELTATDVTRFLQDRAHQLSPGRAKLLVTALRSFLRYLRHQGEISVDLAGCVPPVAVWSLSTVPKFLPAGTVQRVLDQCERDTPDGKRNYAVLLLLARLGLRACEIVALSLDDIDWDNGRITIRCKGGRWAQLPLPADVGEAIAIYLRSGRPRCVCRHVFLRHRAPIRGFAHSITVSTIVRRALIRAGIDSVRKGRPSVPPHTSDRPAPARRFSRRDRRTAPPSKSKHNGPLCQGGLDCIAHLGASLAGRCAMKTLTRSRFRDYLALRRGLGFKLKKHSTLSGRVRIVSRTGERVADHLSACFAMGNTTHSTYSRRSGLPG